MAKYQNWHAWIEVNSDNLNSASYWMLRVVEAPNSHDAAAIAANLISTEGKIPLNVYAYDVGFGPGVQMQKLKSKTIYEVDRQSAVNSVPIAGGKLLERFDERFVSKSSVYKAPND